MSEDGNKRLGRGLSALLGEEAEDYAALDRLRASKEVPVEHLQPNPYQPRHRFDESELQGLVESVKDKGILQPILVRRMEGEGSQYQIIAGERRWRAAQAAKLHTVPVVIRDFSDEDALEIALVENLQRQDLSPIEEANGYKRLMDEFSLTQEKVSARVGKSRSHVANMLRLLNLPEEVREMLDDGRLSAGHARALVSADEPLSLARQIVAGGFNVRQAEKLSRRQKGTAPARKKEEKDADTLALEGDLSAALGLKVTIHDHGNEGGDIRIVYKTLEQLDEVCRRLCHQSDEQEDDLDLDLDADLGDVGFAVAEEAGVGADANGADANGADVSGADVSGADVSGEDGGEDTDAGAPSVPDETVIDPTADPTDGSGDPVSDDDLVFDGSQDGSQDGTQDRNQDGGVAESGEPDPKDITSLAQSHTTH